MKKLIGLSFMMVILVMAATCFGSTDITTNAPTNQTEKALAIDYQNSGFISHPDLTCSYRIWPWIPHQRHPLPRRR